VYVFEEAWLDGAKNKKTQKIIKPEINIKSKRFWNEIVAQVQLWLEAKFQRIRLHLTKVNWNYSCPTLAYNNNSEKLKWRHTLANKPEVVMHMAMSEVEARF